MSYFLHSNASKPLALPKVLIDRNGVPEKIHVLLETCWLKDVEILRLTSRTKNIAPSLHMHQTITKQKYLTNLLFYHPYIVSFYFAIALYIFLFYVSIVLRFIFTYSTVTGRKCEINIIVIEMVDLGLIHVLKFLILV